MKKVDSNLRVFVSHLRRHFKDRLKKVILFGSRARGDGSEESDYDLLLVFDEVTKEIVEFIQELEGEMLYEHCAVFCAFAFTGKDLENREFEPFIMNATKEGVSLFG